MPHAPLIGRRSLLPVAVLAAVALATPAAADVTVPASGLAHAAAAGATVVRDDASSSGRALKLATTRSVSTTLSLSAAARTITVRARGISCAGAPTLRVAVDGGRAVTKTLNSGKYQDLTAGTSLTAGSHHVAVSLTKAYKSRSCRRAIVVDQIRAAGAAAATPAPVAPTATPAPAIASVTATPSEPAPTITTPVDPAPTTPAPTITTPSAPAATPAPTVTTPTTTTPTTTTPAPTATTPATTTTPPVTTPPTDPTPTPPVDTRPKLRWAPPALTSPTTITVAQGDQTLSLDMTKDYIIKLGSTAHVGQVMISGGHNVVMIGGTIGLLALSTKATALSIKNSTGTVHVEGVEFDGTSGREMDAIQIQAPLATVQVQNVRADGILGTYDTNHSDVIQPWGGVAKLRVDRLTADSNYQGIFTRPDQGAIGSVALQNVDMSFNNSAATTSGGYLLWMTTGCDMAPTTLTDVYITPRSGKALSSAVWPTTTDAGCPAKLASNKATWPTLPVTGAVTSGPPPGGSFVPAGSVGGGYTSPGYQ